MAGFGGKGARGAFVSFSAVIASGSGSLELVGASTAVAGLGADTAGLGNSARRARRREMPPTGERGAPGPPTGEPGVTGPPTGEPGVTGERGAAAPPPGAVL